MEKVKAASLLQFQDLISEVIKKVNHVHLPLTQLYSEGKFESAIAMAHRTYSSLLAHERRDVNSGNNTWCVSYDRVGETSTHK